MNEILDQLLTDFANANFDCGAFDDEPYDSCLESHKDYMKLQDKVSSARRELIKYIDAIQSKDE